MRAIADGENGFWWEQILIIHRDKFPCPAAGLASNAHIMNVMGKAKKLRPPRNARNATGKLAIMPEWVGWSWSAAARLWGFQNQSCKKVNSSVIPWTRDSSCPISRKGYAAFSIIWDGVTHKILWVSIWSNCGSANSTEFWSKSN